MASFRLDGYNNIPSILSIPSRRTGKQSASKINFPDLNPNRSVVMFLRRDKHVCVAKEDMEAAATFYKTAFGAERLVDIPNQQSISLSFQKNIKIHIHQYDDNHKLLSHSLSFEDQRAVLARAFSNGAIPVGVNGRIKDPFGCFWDLKSKDGVVARIWGSIKGFFKQSFWIVISLSALVGALELSAACYIWFTRGKIKQWKKTAIQEGGENLVNWGIEGIFWGIRWAFKGLLGAFLVLFVLFGKK